MNLYDFYEVSTEIPHPPTQEMTPLKFGLTVN